jgi:hypothetical protein
MDVIGFLVAIVFFLSLTLIERQNVEMKATLKRIEDKLDQKEGK